MSNIIIKPSSTEKSIRMMESENKLIFIVDRKANKPQIKEALKSRFRIEQIARLGNNHIIYSAFSSETYRKLIVSNFNSKSLLFLSFGIRIEDFILF